VPSLLQQLIGRQRALVRRSSFQGGPFTSLSAQLIRLAGGAFGMLYYTIAAAQQVLGWTKKLSH